MKILVFTTLYPNAAHPNHGIFVENRVRHLIRNTGLDVQVVAPVPWFPLRHPRFGRYADFARVPAYEERHGIPVWHPRYPLLPKIGMTVAPALLYAWSVRALKRLRANGFDFDVIDAHYLYPDGVAGVMLARRFGRPVVLTARGNDVTLLPDYAGPRAWLRWAVKRADRVAAVAEALRKLCVERLAAPEEQTLVLRNGVDLETFTPDGPKAFEDLRNQGKRVILSVGALIERKGHHLTIAALQDLPADVVLAIAGDGPLRRQLADQAAEAGLGDRVVFLGAIPHQDLPAYYRGADLSVLASSREGMANVLLETLACGTRVIATSVSGTPEVVQSPELGLLVHERSPRKIAAALREELHRASSPPHVAACVRHFGWYTTNQMQQKIFKQLAGSGTTSGT